MRECLELGIDGAILAREDEPDSLTVKTMALFILRKSDRIGAKGLVHGQQEANADTPRGLTHAGDKLSRDQELDIVREVENLQDARRTPSHSVRKSQAVP